MIGAKSSRDIAHLQSLTDYILVSQYRPLVEHFSANRTNRGC